MASDLSVASALVRHRHVGPRNVESSGLSIASLHVETFQCPLQRGTPESGEDGFEPTQSLYMHVGLCEGESVDAAARPRAAIEMIPRARLRVVRRV